MYTLTDISTEILKGVRVFSQQVIERVIVAPELRDARMTDQPLDAFLRDHGFQLIRSEEDYIVDDGTYYPLVEIYERMLPDSNNRQE